MALKGGGVLPKSEILLITNLGHYWMGGAVAKVNVSKFDPIFSDLSPFKFEVSASKTFNFPVFTDRTKYYIDWSHKLHDKKRSMLLHL